MKSTSLIPCLRRPDISLTSGWALEAGTQPRPSASRRSPTRSPVLRDVRVVEFPGLGHMAPVTHPEVINAEIARFLGEVSPAGVGVEVDAFYLEAMAAGGRDNGAPGLRPHYHANYDAAFVIGPDGHDVEAVCH